MKKIPVIIGLLCIFQVYGFSQTKRLKVSLPCIPINYAALPYKGLEASDATIKIDTATVAIPRLNADGTTASVAHVNDTIPIITIDMPAKYVFDIIRTTGSYTIIKFWEPKTSNTDISNYEYYSKYANAGSTKNVKDVNYSKVNIERVISTGSTDTTPSKKLIVKNTKDYYLVKTTELLSNSEDFVDQRNAWNVGAMFLPVKLRPFASKSGFFDFTNDISIGASFSWTIKQNLQTDATVNLLLYAGVSSVKVDSAIANFPKEDSILAKSYVQAQNITAFSPAIGIYWQKKNIQLGIVTGMDFLAGKVQKNWVYRGMPWIGLAAGVSIFNITTNKGSSSTTPQQ
ncbi:MAG TPA: hypothetical protein VFW07_18145 [Parafilimonas sp.]|nr:hypothetical protein [Parafilimonas sp.]